MEITRMLFFLDSIIDTRIACVRAVNEGWVDKLVENGYHYRLSNLLSFHNSEIDDAAVKQKWENRDVEILKLGYGNSILQTIAEQRINSVYQQEEHPSSIDIKATLNVWPYKLSSEQRKMFVEILQTMLQTDSVEVIYRDMGHCNPIWIRQNFDHVILYDIQEWIIPHIHNLATNKLPEVTFTFPLCLLDDVNPIGKKPTEIVDYIKTEFAGSFTCDITPLSEFSFLIPKDETESE